MSTSRTAVTDTVALIGAGSLGVGWAIAFARGGATVRLHDPDAARLDAALAEIDVRIAELDAHDLLDEAPAALVARVTAVARLEDAVDGAAYVQECAPEIPSLKHELFAGIDAQAGPEVVLASSTSAIPASQFAGGLPGARRCLVAHPANPPYLLPVVELVPGPETDDATMDRAAAILSRAGMEPVRLTREIEGFVLNRLQGAVLREAYCLVRDGIVSVEDVDRVMRDGLGRRWAVVGPFETSDLNVRGGIAAHAERMGAAYARMGAARGQDDPWTPELVAQVAGERRELLPLEHWEQRVLWRDRALMGLERGRRAVEPFDPS